MKILLLTEVLHPETIGGSGRYIRDLARGLAEIGHEPWILTRNPGGRLAAQESGEGFEIHRYAVPAHASAWLPLVQLASARRAAHELARRIGFDCIHAQQPLVAAAVLGAERLARLPWVYTFQSPWHEEYLIKRGRQRTGEDPRPGVVARAMRSIEGRVVRRASRVIVLSRFSAERVRRLHAPRAPVVRIPGGVDLDHFDPTLDRRRARERLGLPARGRILFTARNLVARMGLENLIDAVARLAATHLDLSLAIGGDGPLRDALRQRIEAREATDRIRLVGRIPEGLLPLYFRAADLFVLPTAQLEGFGLVTVEALASGTPVVATPVGGSLDILGDFHPRSLARGTDAAALGAAIDDFLRHPDAWPAPQACRRVAEQEYAWPAVARRTATVYREAREATRLARAARGRSRLPHAGID